MPINQKCPLILRDCYSYDIQSAYPTILGKQFFDFKDVDLEDKQQRSVFIGLQQRENKELSSFLMESADNLVQFYLKENNVPDTNIIITQRDGFIITELLDNDDEFITMKLREYIDVLILSVDRKKYLYSSEGVVVIKGVPHYFDGLMMIYKMFADLNFYNKSALFDQLDQIKQTIFTTEDKSLFMIPDGTGSYIVGTHKGDIKVKDPDLVPLKSINRNKYYQHFFEEFMQSIFLQTY